jgi:hypothetical protein
VPASLPFIEPCVPREVRQPPKGEDWIHQPKLDGWRCQAVMVGPKVTLYSRQGYDLTRRFPTIAAAIAKLPAKSVARQIYEERDAICYALERTRALATTIDLLQSQLVVCASSVIESPRSTIEELSSSREAA